MPGASTRSAGAAVVADPAADPADALRFAPELAATFDDETWAERYREFRFWLWAWLAFSWATLGLTLVANPEELVLAAGLRLLVFTPAYLAALLALRRRRGPWVESLACIGPHMLGLLLTEMQFLTAAKPDLVRDVIALTFGILGTNFVVPLRPVQAIAYTVITLLAGDAVIAAELLLRHAPLAQPDLMPFGHMLAGLSLLGRLRAEARTRQSFVRGWMLRRRSDELSRANRRLLELSATDPLTGVANRRSYDKLLDQAWRSAALSGQALSVLMIDVDRFKPYNDRMGHVQGDECLRVVARAIVDETRQGRDVVGRFGGEEFIVLLPDTEKRAAVEIAERVRRSVANLALPHPGGIECGVVTVSIGVATVQRVAKDGRADTLVAAADAALYAAKRAGRNRVQGEGTGSAVRHET